MFCSPQKYAAISSRNYLPGQIPGTAIDIDFTRNIASVQGTHVVPSSFLGCARASTSNSYAQFANGLWTTFANNIMRITDQGMLCEDTRTNYALHARDMTNASWVKSANASMALTANGIEGIADRATQFTATGANAFVSQSMTIATNTFTYDVFLQRVGGSGEVDISINGGSTWQPISLTTAWQQFYVTNTLANPNVAIKVTTSGDVINVDFNQCEIGDSPTSPILTTTAANTRTFDEVLVSGNSIMWSLISSYPNTGTYFAQWIQGPVPDDHNQVVFEIFDASAGQPKILYNYLTNGDATFYMTDGTNFPVSSSLTSSPIGGVIRAAMAFAVNDVVHTYPDGTIATFSAFVPPAESGGSGYASMFFGGIYETGSGLDSYVQRFAMSTNRMPNGILQNWVTT